MSQGVERPEEKERGEGRGWLFGGAFRTPPTFIKLSYIDAARGTPKQLQYEHQRSLIINLCNTHNSNEKV